MSTVSSICYATECYGVDLVCAHAVGSLVGVLTVSTAVYVHFDSPVVVGVYLGSLIGVVYDRTLVAAVT